MPDQTLSSSDALAGIVNEVMRENPAANQSPEALIEAVSKKFLNHKLDMFPVWCTQMWMDNQERIKRLREVGNRGKFDSFFNTETYWSNDRNFMSLADVPQELYLFMRIFVYKHFWEDDKVWRKFVQAICDRKGPMTEYEAQNLLIKVKQLYGSNADSSLT